MLSATLLHWTQLPPQLQNIVMKTSFVFLTMYIDRWWRTCRARLMITVSRMVQSMFVFVAPLDLLPGTPRVTQLGRISTVIGFAGALVVLVSAFTQPLTVNYLRTHALNRSFTMGSQCLKQSLRLVYIF